MTTRSRVRYWLTIAVTAAVAGCSRVAEKPAKFVEKPYTYVEWRELMVPKLQGWNLKLGEKAIATSYAEPRFSMSLRQLDQRRWTLLAFRNSPIAAEIQRSGFRYAYAPAGLTGPCVAYERRTPPLRLEEIVFFALTDGGLVRADLVGPDKTRAQLQVFFDAAVAVGGIHRRTPGRSRAVLRGYSRRPVRHPPEIATLCL